MLKHYPFNKAGTAQDPLPLFTQMLADGPIVRTKILLVKEIWMATSWEACNELLRDQDHFGRDPKRAGKKVLPGMQWWMPKNMTRLANNMMAYDKEEHRRLRNLVDQAFLRSEIASLRPRIIELTNELLDVFSQEAKNNRSEADFVKFCRELPLAVICEVLGLPAKDRPMFTKWFRPLGNFSSMWSMFRIISGIRKLLRYLDAKFDELRAAPQPGLLSELVQIEMAGDRLTKDELVASVFILLVAGHETTVHLLSNGVLHLIKHPDQLQLLKKDWSHVGSATDEILRWACPVQFSKPRFVLQDREFHGTHLKRGEMIMACFGSANLDPNKFPNPTQFDVLRSPNPHLTFGTGVHVCLGLKLAKAESEIVLEQVFDRFPNLRLANSEIESVTWAQRLGLRSIKKLLLKVD